MMQIVTRSLPPLNALRAFEAAARHLSFTRAAEELHVTQAAVSHQIRTLEEHLGLPLFRRLTRGLLLTDAGQTLFPPIRHAFDTLAGAVGTLKARDSAGSLTVTVLPSFAAKWLVPRMSRFQDHHPDIDLRIAAGERLVDFARDDVDLGIRFGNGEWPGVQVEQIADEDVTPVCSPTLARDLRRPSDLATAPLLYEDMLPLGNFPTWATWFQAAGIGGLEPARGPRFSHTHMMLQAAIDGHGVALGGTVLIADDLAAGRLVAPFDLAIASGYAYYLVCAPAAVGRSKVRAFRDWIMAETAAMPETPLHTSTTA